MPSRHEQLSQEVRLASGAESSLEWIVGAYYYEDDDYRVYYQLTPVIDPDPTHDNESTFSETTIAAFGQARWWLSDRWRITGGLRINREEHRLATIGSGSEDSLTGASAANRWRNESWRVDFEYVASGDALVYAGVATGFKSGGATILPGGTVDTYDPEDVTAYEAGIKTRWLDRRIDMNCAAFFYDFRNLQVNTSTITETGLIFETDNAAAAEIYGIDAEGRLRLTDSITVAAGMVWLPKREFVEYRNDRTGDTLSGNRLTRAPEWTATAAIDWDRSLANLGQLSARLEFNYRSDYFHTTDNAPQFAQGAFGLLNVYLNFVPAGENWYAFASGRNIGNEDYFNQIFLQASPGYPDTYEAGFGYRF